MIQTLLQNALASSGSAVARIIIGFFLTPILIRSLGAAAYGMWSFIGIFSINGYLTLLSLGLQANFVRDLAAADARGEARTFARRFYTVLAVYAGAGVFGAIALFTIANTLLDRAFGIPSSLQESAHALLLLLTVQTLIDFPALALDGVLEGRQRYRLKSALDTGRFLAFGAGAIAVVTRQGGPVALGLVSLAVSIIGTALTVGLLAYLMPDVLKPVRPRWTEAVSMIRESAALFAIRLNSAVYAQMDRTILATILNTTVVTHYDIAARMNGFAMLPQALPASVILPAASARAAIGDRAELRRMFLVITRYTVMLSSLVTLGLIVVMPSFIRFWIGPDYVEDASLARLFLVIPLFWMFIHVGWNMMVAVGRVRALVEISLATTGLNLVASILLTLVLGLPGVILGTVIGNAVAALLYVRLFFAELGVPAAVFVRDVVARPYVAAISAALVLALVTDVRAPTSLMEVGAYLAAFCLLGGVLSVGISASATERARIRHWRVRHFDASGPA